jgi:nicotinate-nucleotide adenylyltransferase
VNIGVLGGTFDPPHLGHLILSQFALEQLHLDKVLFIPAGDPWRKAERAVTSSAHRLEMTRRAVSDNPAFELDDREVKRSGPSYTVETLREIRQSLGPDANLFFVVGEDALADMPAWRDPEGIAAEAKLAVAPRKDAPLPEGLSIPAWRMVRIEMPYIGISSTLIRERARQKLGLGYLVPSTVAAYIREQSLYL